MTQIGNHDDAYRSTPLEQKLAWFQNAPGLSAVEPARQFMSGAAALYTDSDAQVRATLRNLGADWTGDAATNAGATLQRAADWSQDAGAGHAAGGETVEGYGRSFESLRGQIHWDDPWAWGWNDTATAAASVATMNPTPFLSNLTADYFTTAQQNRTNDATAVAALRAHENQTRTAVESFPNLSQAGSDGQERIGDNPASPPSAPTPSGGGHVDGGAGQIPPGSAPFGPVVEGAGAAGAGGAAGGVGSGAGGAGAGGAGPAGTGAGGSVPGPGVIPGGLAGGVGGGQSGGVGTQNGRPGAGGQLGVPGGGPGQAAAGGRPGEVAGQAPGRPGEVAGQAPGRPGEVIGQAPGGVGRTGPGGGLGEVAGQAPGGVGRAGPGGGLGDVAGQAPGSVGRTGPGGGVVGTPGGNAGAPGTPGSPGGTSGGTSGGGTGGWRDVARPPSESGLISRGPGAGPEFASRLPAGSAVEGAGMPFIGGMGVGAGTHSTGHRNTYWVRSAEPFDVPLPPHSDGVLHGSEA
jgi:hypothetical protein